MTRPHRTGRRRATILLTGLLSTPLAVAGVAVATAADEPRLDQEIATDQPIATDQTVVSDGHVDIGPRYADGVWTLLVHDDHADPPSWRTMPDTVFQVTDAALTTVPDNPDYAFLPAEPGTDVHVVPQAQRPGVIWIGWNTQDPTVMDSVDRGATLSLRGVDGPGDLLMFLQSGSLGEPEVLWDSRESAPQELWVEVNTHAHANWVFTEPGVYLVEVEVSADLVSGEAESDIQLLRFAVGDATGADEAFAAEYDAPADADGSSGDGAADGDAADQEDTGDASMPIALGVGAVGAVLVAVLVIVQVRGRNAKRRAAAGPPAGAGGSSEEGRP